MTWSRRFSGPIALDDGRALRTLRDAGHYLQALSPAEQSRPHWQTAGRILLAAAEERDFLMHAEIAIRAALAHGKPPPPREPRRKRAKKYRLIR